MGRRLGDQSPKHVTGASSSDSRWRRRAFVEPYPLRKLLFASPLAHTLFVGAGFLVGPSFASPPQYANSAGMGGGASLAGSNLTAQGCGIDENHATAKSGGAIAATGAGSDVRLRNCTLELNMAAIATGRRVATLDSSTGATSARDALSACDSADAARRDAPRGDGGAVWVADGASLQVTGSNFTRNYGAGSGAAVAADRAGAVSVSSSAFHRNEALNGGGALAFASAAAAAGVDDEAPSGGGPGLRVEGSTFEENMAKAGGFLVLRGGPDDADSVSLAELRLVNNTALLGGLFALVTDTPYMTTAFSVRADWPFLRCAAASFVHALLRCFARSPSRWPASATTPAPARSPPQMPNCSGICRIVTPDPSAPSCFPVPSAIGTFSEASCYGPLVATAPVYADVSARESVSSAEPMSVIIGLFDAFRQQVSSPIASLVGVSLWL